MVQRAKGSVWILVGSILWIISASMGVLAGLFWAVAGSFLFKLLGMLVETPAEWGVDLSVILMTFGLVIGLAVLIYFTLIIIFAAMCLRRRNDLSRSTFPLVIGIIYVLIALPQLFIFPGYAFSLILISSILAIVFPGLILIGAILNKQQLRSGGWPPPLPVYPQGPPPQPLPPPWPGQPQEPQQYPYSE